MARALSLRLLAATAAPLAVLATTAPAAPAPEITARAALDPRADSSILGFISTSGASELTDLRSCDFPATLTTSGAYATCCAASAPCDFFTACSAGNVVAASTSVFCDQGYCNTGIMMESAGAKGGKSFLGCWATELGKDPFGLVMDAGSMTAAPTATESSGAEETEESASETGSEVESGTGSETDTATSTGQETGAAATSGGSAPSQSSPGTAAGVVVPVGGLVGLFFGLVALL